MTRTTSLPEEAHLARIMTLGELTASIVHELCQPLAAVALNGEAGLRWLDRPAPAVNKARASVEAMLGNVHRIGEIIRCLQALSRKESIDRSRLDLSAVIAEVLPLIKSGMLDNDISLELRLATGAPPVLGNSVQVQQVLLNLMLNGIQAMVPVRNRRRVLTVRSHFGADEASVAVSDTGTGFDAAAVGRLFDPYFTTKPEGVGLGLSICRLIVDAHGGRIQATRNKGSGATFLFTMPVYRANGDTKSDALRS